MQLVSWALGYWTLVTWQEGWVIREASTGLHGWSGGTFPFALALPHHEAEGAAGFAGWVCSAAPCKGKLHPHFPFLLSLCAPRPSTQFPLHLSSVHFFLPSSV